MCNSHRIRIIDSYHIITSYGITISAELHTATITWTRERQGQYDPALIL
jgi:hypothetical protein